MRCIFFELVYTDKPLITKVLSTIPPNIHLYRNKIYVFSGHVFIDRAVVNGRVVFWFKHSAWTLAVGRKEEINNMSQRNCCRH